MYVALLPCIRYSHSAIGYNYYYESTGLNTLALLPCIIMLLPLRYINRLHCMKVIIASKAYYLLKNNRPLIIIMTQSIRMFVIGKAFDSSRLSVVVIVLLCVYIISPPEPTTLLRLFRNILKLCLSNATFHLSHLPDRPVFV